MSFPSGFIDFLGRYHNDIGMKAIHVRDLHPETLAALKRLARSHHRSLQGEVHAILERAARLAPPERDEGLGLTTVRTAGTSRWRREELYDDRGR